MAAKPDPVCKSTRKWVQGHLDSVGAGKKASDCFAPLTGQDSSAMSAFYHLVECWTRADDAGRRACVAAMRATLEAMQPSVRHLAREGIPSIGDWLHEAELWQQLANDDAGRELRDMFPKLYKETRQIVVKRQQLLAARMEGSALGGLARMANEELVQRLERELAELGEPAVQMRRQP